jgi:hypothetical protein
MPENVFGDEWYECLEAHYMHVIRTNDKVTEPSLTYVLVKQVGFTEAQLAELRVKATMRAEDMPDDFVPDMSVLEAVEAAAEEATFSIAVPEMPAESSVPETLVLTEADPSVELLSVEQNPDEAAVSEAEPPPPEAPITKPKPAADEPQQLTLF